MTAPAKSQPVKAALWMMGAVASFTSMAVAGREIAVELNTFELMTYRSIIGIAVVLAVGGVSGTLHQIRTTDMRLHMVRNLGHFAGQNLWFYAVTVIPFAQLFVFEFSSPVWVALFAPLILAEQLTKTRVTAAAMGFIGILLVARPGFVAFHPGMAAGAGAAIGFAVSVIFTKLLTRRHTITCILFWLTVMQAAFGLIAVALNGSMSWPTASAWPLVIVIGIAGLFAHFCITTALRLAPAIIVSPMDFIRLPIIAVIGLLFYGEALEWPVLLGAVVILSANLANISAERRLSQTA